MSQHSSLKGDSSEQQQRSVLKRYERLKQMNEKGNWDEEKSSIFKLPKIKLFKFKVKKEKVAKPEEGAAAAPGAAVAPAPGTAKEAEGAKKTAAGGKTAGGAATGKDKKEGK